MLGESPYRGLVFNKKPEIGLWVGVVRQRRVGRHPQPYQFSLIHRMVGWVTKVRQRDCPGRQMQGSRTYALSWDERSVREEGDCELEVY